MKHYGERSVQRKFRTAKIPYSENSLRRNFRTAKNPDGENSVWRKIHTEKKSYGENSYGENFNGENSGHGTTVATLKENFWLNWFIDFYQAIKKNQTYGCLMFSLSQRCRLRVKVNDSFKYQIFKEDNEKKQLLLNVALKVRQKYIKILPICLYWPLKASNCSCNFTD